MLVNPCRECTFETGRYPGCHDHCQKPEYIQWREKMSEIRRRERYDRQAALEYSSMKSENIAKMKRKYGKGK